MGFFKTSLVSLCTIACLSSFTVFAEFSFDDQMGNIESQFDAMDRQFENDFQQRDEQLEKEFTILDESMERAYQKFSKAISKSWGSDDTKLPTPKVWVDYDENLSSRRVLDYEQGSLTVEKIIQPGESEFLALQSMQQMVYSASRDTVKDLAQKDQALNYAKKLASQQGVFFQEPYLPSTYKAKPVLQNILPKKLPKKILPKQVKKTNIVGNDGKKRIKISYKIPFTKGYKQKGAKKYAQEVMKEAKRRKIDPSLVLAIMQTESAFNPRATSPVPAFGLMQLVPRSGAMDAYQYVFRQKRLVEPEYLYSPSNNVELGVAYLKILDSRYLKRITNKQSRLYCVIAAYNTGAGNVAKTFTGKTRIKPAAKIINKMTPDEVYNYLRKHLPYEETQRYIVKVTKAKKKYSNWDR
ncbi:MAG: DUF3393 domain-containing protein [Methylococcales bacterium]|jgi:membrane-bound lytic murein transglycosylase C|nr:DUF3393 domain-containing protein [Methylococcales bacterium]